MTLRYLGLTITALTALFSFSALAQETPEGVPMGEVQYGNPDAEQGYVSGDATIAGEGTQAYGDANVSEIDAQVAADTFDGSGSDQGGGTIETNIGTVVESNSP